MMVLKIVDTIFMQINSLLQEKPYIKLNTILKKKEINIEVSLGAGKAAFRAMTSDLSEDYVLINSDYRS